MADCFKSIRKRTVISTKPVQPGKSYPLSVLDRIMEHNHIRMVYYYRCPKGREAGETTKKLRESLAKTLTTFPIMTGRLVRDGGSEDGKWTVKCTDAGVRTVEAKMKGSVEELLKSVDRFKELRLVHWEDVYHKPYFWSTFNIQLTEFEEGGIAIGLSCTHLLADPVCATMFIKAWADMTLTRTMSSPPFFHPLPPRRLGNTIPNNKPYTHLINYYKSCIEKSPPLISTTCVATAVVLFTDPMVRACLAMAQRGGAAQNGGTAWRSPFEVLTGLLWVCVSKAKGVREGLMNMSICLDMRKVLGLDKGFFGNCMVFNRVQYNKPLDNDIAENKLSDAVAAITETMKKMDNEGIMDLIEWLERNNQDPKLTNGTDLICVNLENTEDQHSTMFEEGFAPIQESCYMEGPSYGSWQVLILPSPPGEGPMSRVVMVTLPEDMIELLEDELTHSLKASLRYASAGG